MEKQNNKIDLEEIKSRVMISEFARNYLGCSVTPNKTMCCHIHHEKTPSLNFNDEKGFYYCFGCHKSGDVFSLTQEIKNCSFLEAVKFVADSLGIKIESNYNLLRESGQFKEKKEILFNLMKDLCSMFCDDLLKNEKALYYLIERGIKREFISKFQLGYSIRSNEEILEVVKKKYKDNYRLLFDSGVFKKSSYSNDFYNILQHRIIFPIFDKFGRVVAFSGRIFREHDNGPKYINCSDSLIFKKSENLYGENLAIKKIKERNLAIIVEGNIDVILMHQIGLENTVASLGTAISESQLKYLWSNADEIKCIFDGDLAGYKAMLSTIEKGLQVMTAGKFLSFVNLPKNFDPASLILDGKVDGLKNLVQSSKFASEVILKVLWSKYKNAKIEHIAAIKKDLNHYLDLINDEIIRNEYRSYFDEKLKVLVEYVNQRGKNENFYKRKVNKIICDKPIYEKIFCFVFVFLNRFNGPREFIDYGLLHEIYEESKARHIIEKMLKLNLKRFFKENFQLKKMDFRYIKFQLKKSGFDVFADYIENADLEVQNVEQMNYNNCKKLWLKNVDLLIVQSKISDLESRGVNDYENNGRLSELKDKEALIRDMVL